MLILGVNIHGLCKEPIEINVKNSVVKSFPQQLQSSHEKVRLPVSFGPPSEKQLSEENLIDVDIPGLKVRSVEDKEVEKERRQEEESIEINRDFMVRLMGEIDDIGRYI